MSTSLLLATDMESRKFDAEIAQVLATTMRINAEIEKMMDERRKINAETDKINRESRWYPVAVSAGAFAAAAGTLAAGAALAKLFL